MLIKNSRFGSALLALLLATPAGAGEATDAISAQVGRAEHYAENAYSSVWVSDGDTLRVGAERIRLRSESGPIDAPELHSAKCPLELFRAEAARDRLASIMRAAGDDFSIDRKGRDRYGRTVAVVYVEGEDVGGRLVREGHARPWPTLRKKDRPTWC